MSTEEPNEPADRKEVFDYLRNQQKAAEIESKVNGINIWVLWGALGVLLWQFIGVFDSAVWASPVPLLRITLIVQAIILLLLTPTAFKDNDDTRIDVVTLDQRSSAHTFISLAAYALLIGPPIYLILLGIKSIGAILLAVVFAAFIGIHIYYYLAGIYDSTVQKSRFPRGGIKSSSNQFIGYFAFVGLLFLVIIQEFAAIIDSLSSGVTQSFIKNASLGLAVYLLTYFLLVRKIKSEGIDWTYSLETELLLGTMSTAQALRRIEHRQLGPRLAAILGDFFADLDRQVQELAESFDAFEVEAHEISLIPPKYIDQRKAQVDKSSAKIKKQFEAVQKDQGELSQYLSKLIKSARTKREQGVLLRLEKVKSDSDRLRDKVSATSSKFERIAQALSDGSYYEAEPTSAPEGPTPLLRDPDEGSPERVSP